MWTGRASVGPTYDNEQSAARASSQHSAIIERGARRAYREIQRAGFGNGGVERK
jgi:hypothetical protein